MEDCEKIEAAREKVLRARGYTAGEARVHLHAAQRAGGLGHRHAYQHAVAALSAQFDECLHAQEGSPEREAIWAHVRNEYIKLGWDGRGRMLEWHPTWLEDQLSEDGVVQAWLLGRLRTGLEIRVSDGGEAGAVRTREDGRGPALWGEGAKMYAEYTAGSKRLAAKGVSTWADVTNRAGGARWRTWPEMQRAFDGLKGAADRESYEQLRSHLQAYEAGVGREAVSEWRRKVQAGETAVARVEELVERGRRGDGKWVYRRIKAARRTAKSLGGWEYLVEWAGGRCTWEPELDMMYRVGGAAKQEAARARRERAVPSSMYGRLVGEKGERGDGGSEAPCWQKGGEGGEWRWQAAGGLSAEVVEMAVVGRTSEARVQKAVQGLWRVHLKHAEQLRADGSAEEENCSEAAAAERPEGMKWDDAPDREWRTWYAGGRERLRRADGVEEWKDCAGLEGGGEGKEAGVERWVDARMAAGRVEEQEKYEQEGQEMQAMPEGRPDWHVRWNEGADGGGAALWVDETGPAYGKMHEVMVGGDGQPAGTLRDEPLTRMLLRHDDFEAGARRLRDKRGRDEEEGCR